MFFGSFQITALLSLSGGGRFLSNNMMYVTEKLRLGPRGATSIVVKVVVTKSGVHNLTGEFCSIFKCRVISERLEDLEKSYILFVFNFFTGVRGSF